MYKGRGEFAMLEKIASSRQFLSVGAVQIAETIEIMLANLRTLGSRIYKVHRIYQRDL